MRRLFFLFVGLILAFASSGCEQPVSNKDLGTVIYEIPKVPGGDQPYELPKMITVDLNTNK
jgi:hypothetical protein